VSEPGQVPPQAQKHQVALPRVDPQPARVIRAGAHEREMTIQDLSDTSGCEAYSRATPRGRGLRERKGVEWDGVTPTSRSSASGCRSRYSRAPEWEVQTIDADESLVAWVEAVSGETRPVLQERHSSRTRSR